MPKTIKITDEHFAKLHKIARAMGPGATPAHAFQSALDAEHAKHYGASASEGEEGEDADEDPAPREIGADDEDDDPDLNANGAKPNPDFAAGSDKAGAVRNAHANTDAAAEDLPDAKRGGKANPLSMMKRWAQTGASRATQPRAQGRG